MKNGRNYIINILFLMLLLSVAGCVSDVERGVESERKRLHERLDSLITTKRQRVEDEDSSMKKKLEANQTALSTIRKNANQISAMRERSIAFWKHRSDVMGEAEKLGSSNAFRLKPLVMLGDAAIIPEVKVPKDGSAEKLPEPYAAMPLLQLSQDTEKCVIVDMGFDLREEEFQLGAFEILLEGDGVKEIGLAILDEHNNVTYHKEYVFGNKNIQFSREVVNSERVWNRVFVSFEQELGRVVLPRKHRWGLIVPKHAKIPCIYLGIPADSSARNLGMHIQVAPFKDNGPHEFTTPKATPNEPNYPLEKYVPDKKYWEKWKDRLSKRRVEDLEKKDKETQEDKHRQKSALFKKHKEGVADKISAIEATLKPSVSMAVYGIINVKSNK